MLKAKLFLFAAAAAVLTFASCGKDKDNPGNDEPTEVTANVKYSFNGGGDLLVLFDITATYTDASGKEKQDAVGTLPWSAEIKNIKVPFNAKFSIAYTPKTEFVEKESYVVGRWHGIIYDTSDGQAYGYDSFTTMTIAKNKVLEYQNLMAETPDTDEQNIKAND